MADGIESRPSTNRQPCRNTFRAWTRRKPSRCRHCATCSTTPTATIGTANRALIKAIAKNKPMTRKNARIVDTAGQRRCGCRRSGTPIDKFTHSVPEAGAVRTSRFWAGPPRQRKADPAAALRNKRLPRPPASISAVGQNLPFVPFFNSWESGVIFNRELPAGRAEVL
jgi:hypothetical protein